MVQVTCEYQDLDGRPCVRKEDDGNCSARAITIQREASPDEYQGYDYAVCRMFEPAA